MKVLVTGASGFLGRYVLASLREQAIDVVAVGRRLPEGIASAHFIEADLLATTDFAALITAAGASHLLHLAWYTEHGKYWTSPLNQHWVEASTRLVDAFCGAGGGRVVMAGTCAEYDWAHACCREDATPLNPATPYGVAKHATRRLAASICERHRVSFAWGRVFVPYGAGEADQRLVPSLIEVFRDQRPPFEVHASAHRDFLHAADVAAGLTALVQADVVGAYNVSSGQPTQIAEVVRVLAQLLGADPQPLMDLAAERPGEPSSLVGENLKLKALGWRPRLSLAEGLTRTLDDLAISHRR
jgi:nucleoside-diphosphate-sugar epimerase